MCRLLHLVLVILRKHPRLKTSKRWPTSIINLHVSQPQNVTERTARSPNFSEISGQRLKCFSHSFAARAYDVPSHLQRLAAILSQTDEWSDQQSLVALYPVARSILLSSNPIITLCTCHLHQRLTSSCKNLIKTSSWSDIRATQDTRKNWYLVDLSGVNISESERNKPKPVTNLDALSMHKCSLQSAVFTFCTINLIRHKAAIIWALEALKTNVRCFAETRIQNPISIISLRKPDTTNLQASFSICFQLWWCRDCSGQENLRSTSRPFPSHRSFLGIIQSARVTKTWLRSWNLFGYSAT